LASEFCDLYERAPELGEDFLLSLQQTLPRLQAAAVALPLPEGDFPDDDLDVSLSVEEQRAVDWPVHELLEQLDWSAVQENVSEAAATGAPSPTADWLFLYDDLSGIYHDLKRGFRLIEAGRAETEAVFGWRVLFWSHWGYHNAEALRLVHYYVALQSVH